MSTATVTLRISATIANEYANRYPEGIPEEAYLTGKRTIRLESARAILADAEHNSSGDAFSVGKFDMPVGTWRAYKALAKQARKAIARAEVTA